MNSLLIISGDALVNQIVYLVVFGIIFWVLWWLIGKLPLPEPFRRVAVVLLYLAGALVVISFLLGLTGHPIIRW